MVALLFSHMLYIRCVGLEKVASMVISSHTVAVLSEALVTSTTSEYHWKILNTPQRLMEPFNLPKKYFIMDKHWACH